MRSLQLKGNLLAMLAAAIPGMAGCNIASTTKRTLVNEPLLVADESYLQRTFEHLAHQAWREFEKDCGANPHHSKSFKHGFIDGFKDQADCGGTVDPPVQPPRKYWLASHLNPQGNLQAMDYFAGFRQGAEIAQASGVRKRFEAPMYVPNTNFTTSHHPKASRPYLNGGAGDEGDSFPSTLPRPLPGLPGPAPSVDLPPPAKPAPGGER